MAGFALVSVAVAVAVAVVVVVSMPPVAMSVFMSPVAVVVPMLIVFYTPF